MKKLLVIFFAILSCALIGCGSPMRAQKIITVDKSLSISPNARFQALPVEDATKHVWDKKTSQIKTQIFKEAIDRHLQQENMLGEDYTIQTTITHYDPGLGTVILPAELRTRTDILDKEGKLIAIIPIPGIFLDTESQWKEASDAIAGLIVFTLKEATR